MGRRSARLLSGGGGALGGGARACPGLHHRGSLVRCSPGPRAARARPLSRSGVRVPPRARRDGGARGGRVVGSGARARRCRPEVVVRSVSGREGWPHARRVGARRSPPDRSRQRSADGALGAAHRLAHPRAGAQPVWDELGLRPGGADRALWMGGRLGARGAQPLRARGTGGGDRPAPPRAAPLDASRRSARRPLGRAGGRVDSRPAMPARHARAPVRGGRAPRSRAGGRLPAWRTHRRGRRLGPARGHEPPRRTRPSRARQRPTHLARPS